MKKTVVSPFTAVTDARYVCEQVIVRQKKAVFSVFCPGGITPFNVPVGLVTGQDVQALTNIAITNATATEKKRAFFHFEMSFV